MSFNLRHAARFAGGLTLVCASLTGHRLSAESDLLNRVVLQRVSGGLIQPTSVAHAGDASGRLFVTGQSGLVHLIAGGARLEKPFLDLRAQVACCGERGLLGITFHPRFESNGFFYVFYSDSEGDSVLSRFHALDGGDVADPDSETEVLRLPEPPNSEQHKGGQLHFGPDGMLYVSLGDGGPGFSDNPKAQQLDNLYGTILRLDVDSGEPYAVPADNPFVEQPGQVAQEAARGEIWAYGLRNPWRFSFDRLTGDIFIADVGQDDVEEIDFQPATSRGGENYGWNLMEGRRCVDGSTDCNLLGELVEPILEYSHESGCSVIGGYVYRGAALPELSGTYLYGDFCSGEMTAAAATAGVWEVVSRRATKFSITTFGEDESGELYVADIGGELFRIAPPSLPPTVSFVYPQRASAGGPPFSLYLVGANFDAASEVRWNGRLRPSEALDNQRLEVEVSQADVAAAGVAEITVVNSTLPDEPPTIIEYAVEDPSMLSPRIGAGGIVIAAGFDEIPLAPGSIVSVFGEDVAAFVESARGTPLATVFGGGGILFGESFWAPLFYSSPLQMNIQIPWELAGIEDTTARVRVGGLTSDPARVALASHSPAIFVVAQDGTRQGSILIGNSGGTLAAPAGLFSNARPLRPGEPLTMFLTGLGPVTDRPESGRVAGAFPTSKTLTTPEVTVGGVAVRVLFSGLAPGLVGLNQINAKTSEDLPSGDEVPVVVTIGGVSSIPVTMAVE